MNRRQRRDEKHGRDAINFINEQKRRKDMSGIAGLVKPVGVGKLGRNSVAKARAIRARNR